MLDSKSYLLSLITCGKCGWKGPGKETITSDFYDKAFAIDCNKCGNFIKLISYAQDEDVEMFKLERWEYEFQHRPGSGLTTTRYHDWEKIDSHKYGIRWDQRPFHKKSTIRWKGLSFHIRISELNTDTGFLSEVIVVAGKEKYRFGSAQSKYMAGSLGEPPVLTSDTHSLRFIKEGMALYLVEIPGAGDTGVHNPDEFAFEFSETPENIQFEEPIPLIPVKPKKLEWVLYSFEDAKVIKSNCVYFEGEDLVVDAWEMGRSKFYEVERFITVPQSHLPGFYKAMQAEPQEKEALLMIVTEKFKGSDSFDRFKDFLKRMNIFFRIT